MRENKNIYELTGKFISGNSSLEELEEVIKLFSDPYHHLDLRPALYDHWKENAEAGLEETAADQLFPVLDRIHHRIHLDKDTSEKRKIRNWFFTVLKVAAVLLVGLVAGILISNFNQPDPLYYASISPRGSVSQLVLPDNTMVYLNAGSEIRYSSRNDEGTREVYLEGEAWFDVTQNKKIPFVVHTPAYDIRVLGTKFNVKAYKEDIDVVTTLEEGIIEVVSSESVKLKENIILNPGEQLTYLSENKSIEVKRVNPVMYTSWKDNRLIFINMNLKELIVLMERKYGVEIEVTDNVLLNYHYDGTIRNESVLEVMDLLRETLPIQYKIEGQTILITKK